MMEFHISRRARDRYSFAEPLFSLTGNVVFANLSASRDFAHRMNRVRDIAAHPERAVHPGALFTMGLIDEASHAVMARYREQVDPAVMTDAIAWFSGQVGDEALEKLLLAFVKSFPGVDVYRGHDTPQQWLNGSTDGMPHRAAALEELMLLWMANQNEAFRPFEELFEDSGLAARTAYEQVTEQLPAYFATRPRIEVEDAGEAGSALDMAIAATDGTPSGSQRVAARSSRVSPKKRGATARIATTRSVTIFELLRAPALAAPGSLTEQLAHVQKIWKPLLGTALQRGLRIAAEMLREEEVANWKRYHPGSGDRQHGGWGEGDWSLDGQGGDGVSGGSEAGPPEYEKFSADVAWMPTTVLLAKSTYVWLAQLSKQYGRDIHRLDQIPDEELALLARRGMNSLWLIGVWERSRASKTIKQLCGNSDAVASAYSLFDYNIAEDLGGESAYEDLRNRAYRQGIRLASDMVANHMGIDSPWVVEHPEWFLSRHDSPYPAYNFDGPDLSSDPRVEIKIEKHYYEQTDAAVVFRRIDRRSGEMRYIYHGNDGTSFPWNDTAQLDYMNAAVREQVIQTILRVARMFPVIRFDAAMTLAKRHFHRLWFPGEGASGSIPSRAEYSMTDAEFNAHMPHEFWREVVDRVAVEVPGTLLLAEAFWLMEGYFVRTLGMHRVYNSAFMVMLRDEDNANYRSVLKKTLEFDPDIMKRYVNFMSNPDERTAIDQFGNGDKCFGVAALMATLPGLPMFGHGQIEGYTEKYGMEYRRPRYDETPDRWLVERHDRQIAPLLHQRHIFAESSNFLLYDFVRDDGGVEEDVFAYSNRSGDQRGVVLYNNRHQTAHGRIDYSVLYADKGAGVQRQQRLRDSLGFSDGQDEFLAFTDSLTGLEYLRRAPEIAERGLRMDLQGYQCHVFLHWREVRATATQRWDKLCDLLDGHGVPNLDNALINLELEPAHDALRLLFDPARMQVLVEMASLSPTAPAAKKEQARLRREDFFEKEWKLNESFLRQAQAAYIGLLQGPLSARPLAPALLATKFRESLRAALRVPLLEALSPEPWPGPARRMLPSLSPQLRGTAIWAPVVAWLLIQVLAESLESAVPGFASRDALALDLFDRLRLREPLGNCFAALGMEGEAGWQGAARVRVLLIEALGIARAAVAATNAAAVRTTAVGLITPTAATDSGKAAINAVPGSPHAGPSFPGLAPALWQDADVRWLTGLHDAKGRSYFVKECYEEVLWWLQLPELYALAGETKPDRNSLVALSSTVAEGMMAAAAAGYSTDMLPKPAPTSGPAVVEAPIHEKTEVSKSAAAPEAVEVSQDQMEGEADEVKR